MSIKDDFMKNTKMLDPNNTTRDGVYEIVSYLSSPEIVNKMIIASELELPVLTLIAKDLEEKFDENSNFPVVVIGDNKNATARQNVGRIIKYIMREYGYTPILGGLSERARIPAISNSKYFSTSAVYKKTDIANYEIEVKNKSKATSENNGKH